MPSVQDQTAADGGVVDDLKELQRGLAFQHQAVGRPDGAGVHRDPEDDEGGEQRGVQQPAPQARGGDERQTQQQDGEDQKVERVPTVGMSNRTGMKAPRMLPTVLTAKTCPARLPACARRW